MNPLNPEQVASWREHGFCIVNAVKSSPGNNNKAGWVFTQEECDKFRQAARVGVLGDGKTIAPLPDTKSFGGITFPFLGRKSEPVNDLVLHPRMLGAAKQLLQLAPSQHVVMTQADCWVKRDLDSDPGLPAEYVNTDQRLHMDFPNHYLCSPTTWYEPEAVSVIVYLDEYEECGGPTMVVPRKDANDPAYKYPYTDNPGVGVIPWLNDKTYAENYLKEHFPSTYEFRQKLYDREFPVKYTIGTCLFYRLDIWHRGSPLKKGKDRAVVNLIYKKPEAAHITSWHKGWAQNAYNTWALPNRLYPPEIGHFERLLSTIDPDQRATLGFPPVDSPYWNEDTLRAVEARYPMMDIKPYRLAMTNTTTHRASKPASSSNKGLVAAGAAGTIADDGNIKAKL